MTFKKPELDEVLDVILPGLRIPKWDYKKENDADRELGKRAWKMSRSFRRLRTLLEGANVVAELGKKPCIDKDCLQRAFDFLGTDVDKRQIKPSPPDDEPTDLEDDSERRNDGKDA